MKPALAGIVLALTSTFAFAQPDVRDSIILESKSVAPGFYPGTTSDTGAYFYLKVYITNKDTLTAAQLAAVVRSVSGGAYALIAWPRNVNGTVSWLTNTLNGSKIASFTKYHSNNPDTFLIAGVYDPLEFSTVEPPNSVRKPFWEVKFDTVLNKPGVFEVDSAIMQQPPGFVDIVPRDIPVNVLKAVITVMQKGDLNLDGSVTAADAMWEVDCVYSGQPSTPAAVACDLSCDGRRTAADIVWELQAVFLGRQFPC